jgi:hypothetical protein
MGAAGDPQQTGNLVVFNCHLHSIMPLPSATSSSITRPLMPNGVACWLVVIPVADTKAMVSA